MFSTIIYEGKKQDFDEINGIYEIERQKHLIMIPVLFS